jgi:hypothetical protein
MPLWLLPKEMLLPKELMLIGWLRAISTGRIRNWQFLTSENFFNNVFWILHQSQESMHKVKFSRWIENKLWSMQAL